jgi:hypothetical protein
MDFTFLLYIFLSFVIGIGGAFTLVQMQKSTAAILYLVGALCILVFFGLRWFSGDSLKVGKLSTGSWPPAVNLCPDFLSIYERTINGAKEKVCVDLIGVATQGGIQKMTAPEQALKEEFIFHLFQNQGRAARQAALCQHCKDKKVTWEGIYDGVTCVGSGLAPGDSADSLNQCYDASGNPQSS